MQEKDTTDDRSDVKSDKGRKTENLGRHPAEQFTERGGLVRTFHNHVLLFEQSSCLFQNLKRSSRTKASTLTPFRYRIELMLLSNCDTRRKSSVRAS